MPSIQGSTRLANVQDNLARLIVFTIDLCSRCGQGRDIDELLVNFGICDECFEEDCPCNNGYPGSCPLHRRPDIVLNYSEVT